MRAIGHYSVAERIADATLATVSAHRSEFLAAHGAKNPPDPISYIAAVEKAKAPPPTIEDIYQRISAIAPPLSEKGDTDASRVD